MRNPWGEDRAWDARNTRDETPLPGVIDTIGNGFAALAMRPFVALPLLLLDLYLLLMPQLTLRPLTGWVEARLNGRGDGWDGFLTELERLERFNAFDLAVIRMPLARLPALVPAMTDAERSKAGWDLAWSGFPIWSILVASAGIFVAGLLISALYRSLMSTLARPDATLGMAIDPSRIARLALRVFGWVLVVIGLITLVSMPVLILTIAGALLGLESLTIAWIFVLIPISWGYVHFYFSIHALFLDGCGPFAALKTSYRVVRRHFWESIQFILLTFILTTGLNYALSAMAADPYGVFLAIVLNAFIATGMIVAAMLFYRDRAARLDQPASVPVSGR
jgi:hypothetical protein